MSTATKVSDIKIKVLAYEHTPYTRCLPLAQHAFLQLFPIVGNIIVCVQTTILVRRINKLVPIPLRERVETWASICILLLVGMIPVLGLWLTYYCTHCSDHLLLALRQLRAADAQRQEPADLEEGGKEAAMSPIAPASPAVESMAMSPIAKPTSSKSTTSSLKRAVSAASSKMSFKEKPASIENPTIKAPAVEHHPSRPPTQRKHSVFDRVSKMPWMDEVMATSPTDNHRTSLSVNAMASRPKMRYDTLHDLATRNSKLAAGSFDSLPSYLTAARSPLYTNDDLLLSIGSKRLTRSLLIDDGALDRYARSPTRAFGLARHPEYHSPSPRSAVSKSSSLVGLAPSPQIL
ncbi:hypothetical protein H4R19_001664 [Coemansia spiralis]|nr:hypothetical protein H4R19_001664 [Coemansia spiralis]